MDRSDRVLALSLIWATAKEVYPYFDRLETDWDASYRDYLPQLMDETDELGVWLRLAAFTRILNDGHSTLLPPKALSARLGFVPFRLRQFGGRFLIAAAARRELLLRELLGIDGLPAAELVARLDRVKYTADGHPFPGTLERWLPLLLPDGPHVLQTDAGDFPFSYEEKEPALISAPEPESSLPSRAVGDKLRLFEDGLLCARIDDMVNMEGPKRFQEALAREKPRGVLFDIRRNIGGMTLCGARYAQPFFADSFGGCLKWTQARKANDAASASQLAGMSAARAKRMIDDGIVTQEDFAEAERYSRHTQVERYRDSWDAPGALCLPSCPVLLLVSRDTISAAEDFAAFFRSNGRGLILGETSFGSTGSPCLFRLPDGGRGQVVSVGCALSDGTPFVGCGIKPDVPCAPDPEDWRTGQDRQLDAAVETLRGMAEKA